MLTLDTPIIQTTVVDSVRITRINNNIDGGYISTEYVMLKEDGTEFGRGAVMVEGKDAVKALYAETDVVMATGKTFEEASASILYNKIIADIST